MQSWILGPESDFLFSRALKENFEIISHTPRTGKFFFCSVLYHPLNFRKTVIFVLVIAKRTLNLERSIKIFSNLIEFRLVEFGPIGRHLVTCRDSSSYNFEI